MYFSLGADGRDNVYMAADPQQNSHVELGMGIPWDVADDDIEIPYRYEMRVVAGQQPHLYAWYPGSDLMQQALVDVLQRAGVDNLQTFPAVVRREGSGEEVPGYVVVNIVGRVSCADMSRSQASPLADVHYFHKLTVDPDKARGLLMFRVDESPMLVLLHESVAAAIKSGSFTGLTLEPVAETPK